ncbi:MAG: 6-phosphogluconate dehydrogenase [Bacteroidota bacterium]
MTVDYTDKTPNNSKLSRYLLLSALIVVLGFVIYFFICGFTYSEGTRSGILTKISKKGYLFKTYEGEINIGGLFQNNGTIVPTTIFYFSVTDKKIYYDLQQAEGKRVIVYYKQVFKNFFWQGDTDYFVYQISIPK